MLRLGAAAAASPAASACARQQRADALTTAATDAGGRDARHAGPADGKGEDAVLRGAVLIAQLHCSPLALLRPVNLPHAACSAPLAAHAPCRTVMCRWIRGLSAKPSSPTLKSASMRWRACAPLASSSTLGATWGPVSDARRQAE
jgi:hypothetical protein